MIVGVGWKWEREMWGAGHDLVAGVDEAGRGPIAGPVVAASVILPRDFSVSGLDDSKKLTAKRREDLYQAILEKAVAWSVVFEDSAAIDLLNILQASLRAMARSVLQLNPLPHAVLVDGSQFIPLESNLNITQEAIVRGDGTSSSIAAASIIAKVSRDRKMEAYDLTYPGYGFAQHKGYGTRMHREALSRLGATPIHRKSFSPVSEMELLFESSRNSLTPDKLTKLPD